MDVLAEAILEGKDLRAIDETCKHADWVEEWVDNYEITSENIKDILRDEVGKVFAKVLECAGVYKRDEDGLLAFKRFLSQL